MTSANTETETAGNEPGPDVDQLPGIIRDADRGLLAALEAALANHIAGDPDGETTSLGDPQSFLLALGEQGLAVLRRETVDSQAEPASGAVLAAHLGALRAAVREFDSLRTYADDEGRLLADVLAQNGMGIVHAETGRPTTGAVAEGADRRELDTWADVHLLGHTVRSGRLTSSREIPGFLDLVEPDGTRRAINPGVAVFEIEYRTEAGVRSDRDDLRDPWKGRTVAEAFSGAAVDPWRGDDEEYDD